MSTTRAASFQSFHRIRIRTATQPEMMLNLLLCAHVLGLRYRFARFRPRVTKQRRLQATQAQTLDRVEHFRVLVGACHDLADL